MAKRAQKPSGDSSPPQRATRSKAAAPAGSPASTRKRGRPQQPSSSAVSTPQKSRVGAASGARGSAKNTKTATTAGQTNAREEVEQVAGGDEENNDQSPDENVLHQGNLNNSNLSGETAVAQYSNTIEVERLKTKHTELITSLPDLNDDASRVLRLITPRTADRESTEQLLDKLQDDTQVRAELEKRARPVYESIKSFGSSIPDGYIRVDLFLHSIFGDESISNAAVWRPDDILYKGNLARITSDVMTRTGDSQVPSLDEDVAVTIKGLVDSFHLLFFGDLMKRPSFSGESGLVHQTFKLMLDLRSQYAINLLFINEWNQRKEDPKRLVYAAFTETGLPAEDDDLINVDITGWHVGGLQDRNGSLLPEHKDIVLERCSQIYVAFQNYDGEDFSSIEQVAPWRDFQIDLALWAKSRVKEMDAEISKQQGADEIAAVLATEVKRRQEHPGDASFISRLTGLDPRTMAKAVGQMSKSIAGSKIIPASIRRRQEADDSTIGDDEQIVVDTTGGEPAGARATPKSTGNQRKRLIDRQANAQKIDFGDSQQSHTPSRQIKVSQNTTSQEDPVTPDDGFQRSSGTASAKKRADNRRATANRPEIDPRLQQQPPPPSSKRARQQEEAERPTPRKRARIADEADAYVPAEQTHQAAEEEAEVEREEEEEDSNIAPPSSNYASVNENARLVTAMREGNRPPQKRTFWDAEECDALIYYIGAYGVSWSKIKEMDRDSGRDVLVNRDQVGLKDKARNMKFDYLKAGVTLPRNFEKISLDKKLRDKLVAYGIDADA